AGLAIVAPRLVLALEPMMGGELDPAVPVSRDDLRCRKPGLEPAPGHPPDQLLEGPLRLNVTRLVDDAAAAGEPQDRDPSPALVGIGKRWLDLRDGAGAGAVVQGDGDPALVGGESRDQIRGRV